MTAAASAYLSVATLSSQRAKRPNVTAVGMLCPLVAGPERGFAAVLSRIAALACFVVGVAFGGEASAAATDSAYAQALEIEGYLHGFPKRAQDELALLLTRADAAPPNERRYIYALYGQAAAAAGRNDETRALADRLEREASTPAENPLLATAKLLRSTTEWRAGDAAKANAFAKEARTLLDGSLDPYLRYWAAMSIGITARSRGQLEESLGALQDALSMAEQQDNPYRRSGALLQLSNLYLTSKQPQSALDASLAAYRYGEGAGSTTAMVKARMAESAALEVLEQPVRELAAMEDALALARTSRSKVGESLALINLADIKLRRKEFGDALALSRRSLAIANEYNDVSSIATSKANIGFALFGLGRSGEGKRYADEALAEYERTGATIEIALLLGEYGQYLEKAGDYKAALAFYHRERKLYEDMAAAAHQRSVLELQEKYESDKSRREIELLNRQNALNSARAREPGAARARLVAVRGDRRDLALRARRVSPQAQRQQRPPRAEEPGALRAQQPRSADGVVQPPLFPGFHARCAGARRAPPPRGAGPSDPRAAPDRHRPLQADQRPLRPRRGRCRARRHRPPAARDAAGNGHDRPLGRRGVSGVRSVDLRRQAGRDRGAHHEGCRDGAGRVPGKHHSRHGFGRLCADAPAAGRHQLPWERAVSLVDMALYMAKLHGRNCAYGIRKLRRSDDEAMTRIERNLESAWANGMVEMHLEPGPELGTVDAAVTTPSAMTREEAGLDDVARRVA